MKKLIFILVLALFLKPVFPVLEYAINYDYISKVLCVNKEKPALHCNGKCHLMKELAKASETEKPNSTNKKPNVNLLNDLFVEDIESFTVGSVYSQNKFAINWNYSNLYSHLSGCSVFHPPTIIS